MINNQNIKDAITCATIFGLQSRFTLEELVVPAILQDRMMAVEAYADGNKSMQSALVKYFDSLIGLHDRGKLAIYSNSVQ